VNIHFIDLPIIKDNDRAYLYLLESVINSVDELSTLEVRKNPNNFSFRIALSGNFVDPLIKELNSLHNLIKVKVDFSKSIKTSSTLYFKINFVNS